ncbi:UbiA family prenyltransferase [Streptacidiphilus sp. N1-12]|uniref:UbiA family prenyltransferase n=2 Tax=Streptacidiphilus alkalitolerans TaxID=3342712 RepID=A0ABV6V960_9ACTN
MSRNLADVAEITHGISLAESQLRVSLRYARLSLAEARPAVQVVFLLRFAVGAALSVHQQPANPLQLVGGLLAWWLAVVAAYLLNGVMDVQEDRANGSARPIARGDLPERAAARITALAALGSLALSVFVPGLTVWVAAFLLLGWLYSAPPFPAKQWSSACALVVLGLGWTSFAAGTAAAGGGQDRIGLVFAGVMSAWMALVGSVVKDLSDLDGDAVGGRRTLAVRRGDTLTRRVAAAGALTVGTAAVLAPSAWAPFALAGTAPVAVGAVCVVVQIVRTAGGGGADKRTRRSAYRAFMRTQYAANTAMLLALLLDGPMR